MHQDGGQRLVRGKSTFVMSSISSLCSISKPCNWDNRGTQTDSIIRMPESPILLWIWKVKVQNTNPGLHIGLLFTVAVL